MNIDISLNKKSHIPIYFQIQKQIRNKIENSDIKAGTQLPTERELSTKLDVSRVTVRKAVRGLIAEGYCEKKVGKGIFVTNNKIPTNIHSLEGTTEFLKEKGFEIQTQVIKNKVITPNSEIKDKLKLNNKQKALFLKRLRSIKKEPVMLEKTYLPLPLMPEIQKNNFSGSLYEILRTEYNLYPDHAEGHFNILMGTEKESELLNVQLNTPLLIKEAVVYTEDKKIIEYNSTIFRTDKFEFIFNSRPQS